MIGPIFIYLQWLFYSRRGKAWMDRDFFFGLWSIWLPILFARRIFDNFRPGELLPVYIRDYLPCLKVHIESEVNLSLL